MEQTEYLVPTGDGLSKVHLSVGEIVCAEERLKDVAIVNNFNAPELLSFFNDIWLKLNKSVTWLAAQKTIADNSYRRACAEAKLNCTDEVIKAKGHSKASADLREAFVEVDPEVVKTKERLDEITAVHVILVGKQQAFYNAFGAVKRMVDSRTLPGPSYSTPGAPQPYTTIPSPQPTALLTQDIFWQQKPVENISKTEYNSTDDDFDLPPGFKAGGSR